jgi:hypothetical protein
MNIYATLRLQGLMANKPTTLAMPTQTLLKKKPRFYGAFFFVCLIYLLNKSAFPSD